MGDGTSDGYRMELEARARDERMSRYGREACFYCGEAVPEGSRHRERQDHDRHMHLSGPWVSRGQVVNLMPEEIEFCSQQCIDWWRKVQDAAAIVRNVLEGGATAAVKLSLLKSMEKTLKGTARPNV